MSGVTCQVSGARCHLSGVRRHLSTTICQRKQKPEPQTCPLVRCHVSLVMCQVSCVKCHVSDVTCRLSRVMCQVSHVTDHVSHVIYSFFLAHEHPKFCKICHACPDYSTWLLFFRILVTLAVFMFSMIFQLIPPVLLPPTNYCFHDQVITPLPGVPLK